MRIWPWERFPGCKYFEVSDTGERTIPANTTAAFWLTVRPAEDARAGLYRGRVRFESQSGSVDFDLQVQVPAVPWRELGAHRRGESSAEVARRVLTARERQRARYGSGPPRLNSEMGPAHIAAWARPGEPARALLDRAAGMPAVVGVLDDLSQPQLGPAAILQTLVRLRGEPCARWADRR